MAKLNIYVILILFPSLFLAGQIHCNHATEAEALIQNKCHGHEKLATIVYYVQDHLGEPNKTVYEVAHSSITSESPTSFGRIRVFDDLITAEPDPNSEKVGRVQGFNVNSDFDVDALTMSVIIYLTSGPYNGSTLTMLGRFEVRSERRELSIVGGTGFFRFARGYAVSATHSYDEATDYAILRYTVYATYVTEPEKSL